MAKTSLLYVVCSGLVLAFLAQRSLAADDRREPSTESTVRQVGIQLETKTGKLDGTLDLPAGEGPFPVVIVIAGSGPTDRDGNQPGIKLDIYKQLGHALARRGVAVLRYDWWRIDKSGAAAVKEKDLRFEMLVDDAVQWIKSLRKDRRFARIGIIGHSQGSLVGTLAARKEKVEALVCLAGPGRTLHAVLREQFGKNLPQKLAKEGIKIIDELAAGRTVADVPKGLEDVRPSVQPFLISLFKYDPAAEIAKLDVPVQIVHGTEDERIKTEDAKLLAKANDKAELRLIDGMNHVLRRATNPLERFVAWNTSKAPLVPEFVDRVSAFFNKTLRESP